MTDRPRASHGTYEDDVRQRWSARVLEAFTHTDVYHDGVFVGILWKDRNGLRIVRPTISSVEDPVPPWGFDRRIGQK